MKLSKLQSKVIKLMQEGWELGQDISFNGTSWLQENGIGRGGKTEDVKLNTLWSLVDRKLIKSIKERFPFRYYALTEEGEKVKVE